MRVCFIFIDRLTFKEVIHYKNWNFLGIILVESPLFELILVLVS